MAADSQKVDGLLAYCSQHNIQITKSISAEYRAGSGLGIYTTSAIRSGEVLIHAPTSALLTKSDISFDFLSDAQTRDSLTVHGLLAAWLAFGDETEHKKNEPWMAIMPSWAFFRDSMPMFWELEKLFPDSAGSEIGSDGKRARLSNIRISKNSGAPIPQRQLMNKLRSVLSPAIQGSWASITKASKLPNTSPGLCQQQLDKVKNILLILHHQSDHLGFDILSHVSREELIRFLYMWNCVNSRCFYYVPHKTVAPKDPNEALALVPFMDLFNHSTTGQGAYVKYDKKGFTASADQNYEEGREIFIQYGSHSNDTLWTEYGFMLENNEHDEINIDDIVLADISNKHREALQDANYLAGYTLSASEISYRLEIVAWLLSEAISQPRWESMVAGTYDPEDDETKTTFARILLKRNRKIVTWLMTAKNECQSSITSLLNMARDPAEMTQQLVPCRKLLDKSEDTEENVLEIARKRHNLCFTRWKQIYDLCVGALRRLEDQSPSAFLTGSHERNSEHLRVSADNLVESIDRSLG